MRNLIRSGFEQALYGKLKLNGAILKRKRRGGELRGG